MYRKIREAQQGNREEGFTLIELLVVVIIGILAAIAIPVFLNQRRKAWDSAVKSDLRNAATAQESWFTDNATYTNSVTNLETEGFNQSSAVTGFTIVVTTSPPGYCMDAEHTSDPAQTKWYLNNTTGAPERGTCPTA